MTASRLACTAALLAALGGCAVGKPAVALRPSPTPSAVPQPSPSPSPSHSPGPCRLAMGGTFHERDPARGLAFDITLSDPTTSTHALADYAASPSRGYYLTVQARFANHGSVAVPIDPLTFLVDAGGRLGIDVNGGNAPYSGASRQLDATAVDPGGTLSAPITYDVPGVHGSVRFKPGVHTSCSWSF